MRDMQTPRPSTPAFISCLCLAYRACRHYGWQLAAHLYLLPLDGRGRHLSNRQKLPYQWRDDREILCGAHQELVLCFRHYCQETQAIEKNIVAQRRLTIILLGEDSSPPYRGPWKCGRGEIGRRNGLRPILSARGETCDAELLKFGETFQLAIPSQAVARKHYGRCRD